MLTVAPTEGFDSLVSVADAVQYAADFGHIWPADEAKQEIALRQATQFLLSAYSIKSDYLDPVHARVKSACCEAAVRAAIGPLLKDTDGRVMTEQTVDVITTVWAEGGQGGRMTFPVIDALLKGLTDGSAHSVKLVRG